MSAAVGVISKLPRAGRTKTRLAATLGAEPALALHRAFLSDELAELYAPNRWSLYLICDRPRDELDRAELDRLCGGTATPLVPDQPDLAHELLAAFESLLATHERAVIVSGDVPQLPAQMVDRALAALEEADIVLGPNPDGGYYLVGQRAPHDVFTTIPMSTPVVEAATRAAAEALGLRVATLPMLTDMDEAQDLLALQAAPETVARRTRAVLSELGRTEICTTLPSELQVEVTSRCNLKCSVCLRTHRPLSEDRDLRATDFHRIIDGLPALDRVAFQLNGEPLLCDDLPQMIGIAKEAGAQTVVNTNGVLLNAQRRGELLRSGIDAVRVSVHGGTASTHNARVGAPVFDRVLQNVEALARERPGRDDPWLSLWMVATSDTIGELPELIRVADRVGADGVYVQRLVVTGEGGATSEASLHGRVDGPIATLLEHAEELARSLGVALRASGRVPPAVSLSPPAEATRNPWLACWRPWRSAVVTASLEVLPCCISSFRAPYADQRLGNRSELDWESLWNDAPYRKLRRGLLAGRPAPWCMGCTQQWSL